MTPRELRDRRGAAELRTMFARLPGTSKTCTSGTLRELLLADDGSLHLKGQRFTIKSECLNAGVYRVWLER